MPVYVADNVVDDRPLGLNALLNNTRHCGVATMFSRRSNRAYEAWRLSATFHVGLSAMVTSIPKKGLDDSLRQRGYAPSANLQQGIADDASCRRRKYAVAESQELDASLYPREGKFR